MLFSFINSLSDHGIIVIASLAVLAFVAGFIDAVVGGGGLIQIPALLINLPTTPIATLFGTNKIASISGTSMAALQYARRITFNYRLLAAVCVVSAAASFAGARTVSYINVNTLKPVILFILIVIAIYTYFKKDLGSYQSHNLPVGKQVLYGSLIALIVGFYDGFFGPGAGSFLVLGFVVVLGFDFINASAYSKIINTMTNLGALFVFIRQGNFIIELALLMAACNVSGSIIGTRMALRIGNAFVRRLFLIVVSLMIARYAWDIIKLLIH